MRLLKSGCLILALILLFVPRGASAQVEHTQTETFTLYSKTHTLTRPADLTGYPADLAVIKDAIATSVQYYDEQWRTVAPIMWLQLINEPSPLGRLAEAARIQSDVPQPGLDSTATTRKDVCQIRIYNTTALSDVARLKYTLAHELVHCYQGYLIPALGNNGLPTDATIRGVTVWWLEGSADWLAPHVYPIPGGELANRQTIFNSSHNRHLIDGGHSYDAMFFWESLERSLGGLRGPLDILTRMPLAAAAQASYLGSRADIDTLFGDFALAAAQGRLPHLTDGDLLFGANIEILSGGRATRTVSKFAIDPFFIPLDARLRRGLKLTVTGQSASGITVKLRSGQVMTEGTGVALCNLPADRIELVASRADKGRANQVTITVAAFTCVPTRTPTVTPSPTPSPMPFNADKCYGTWQLATFPQVGGVTLQFAGSLQLTLERNGNTRLVYQDFTVTTLASGQTIKSLLNGTLKSRIQFTSEGIATSAGSVTGVETLEAKVFINGEPVPRINIANTLRSLPGMGIPANARLVCTSTQLFVYLQSGPIREPIIYSRIGS